jgi:demethylmenaquinone methyltransferase/2-methoxy-6-polyprenyl-1,4-benzoquinol methylase
VAEAKIQKRAIRNISLHQMDATRMSFRDGEFDIVMISFALHELDYELMMRILSEMSRVVKPDGKLYIIDYEQGDSFLKNLILSAHLKIFEPSHMPRFLQYDWNKILGELRFQVVGIEKYLFSKLISAVRGSTL